MALSWCIRSNAPSAKALKPPTFRCRFVPGSLLAFQHLGGNSVCLLSCALRLTPIAIRRLSTPCTLRIISDRSSRAHHAQHDMYANILVAHGYITVHATQSTLQSIIPNSLITYNCLSTCSGHHVMRRIIIRTHGGSTTCRHMGHVACCASHGSTQPTWNTCPQPGSCLTACPASKSSRHTAHAKGEL